MEAMGMRGPYVANPDEEYNPYAPGGQQHQQQHQQPQQQGQSQGQQGQQGQGQQQYPGGQAYQAYLQHGPHPSTSFQNPPASSSGPSNVPDSLRPGASTPGARPGSAVVVHADGGRVVMRKGDAVDEEGEDAEEGEGQGGRYRRLMIVCRRGSGG
ncbi:hypothetical protein B0H34DRAFT_718970, partial [Crassisporium funariophilum]